MREAIRSAKPVKGDHGMRLAHWDRVLRAARRLKALPVRTNFGTAEESMNQEAMKTGNQAARSFTRETFPSCRPEEI
jgi:hypothetical protein